jgi:uncharacterized protein involved in exopolysaccharide biosynthesis
VSLVPASKVLEVSLEWPSPTEAEKILDAVLNEYMEQRIKILNPANTSEFFTIQVERFRSQLDDAKNELVELATANATPDPEREITSNLDVRRSITGRITDLVTREIELEEELEYVDSVLSDGQLRLYSFINSEAMADLSRNLIELSVERGEIARTYSDEARRVAAIDKQILETSAQLRREASDHRGQIENRLDSVRRQIEALESEIERIDARNVDLQIQAIETESLKKEVELLSDSFSTFYRRREESEIPAVADESLSLFYVSILSPAHASSSPIFPNRPLIMGLGIIGGLVVGFTLGFLREFADHSFKVPRDVEQFTNQKVLFSIPVS